MNGAHWHLMLNHFPLIGFFFAFLVLIFGLVLKNPSYLRVGFLLFAVSGLFAVPTFLTGEPAEKVIEHSPTFSENLMEAHHEAAGFAIWSVEATAALSIAAFFLSLRRGRAPKILVSGITALSLLTLALLARTNNLGGKISHPEIRDSSSSGPAGTP